MNNMTTETMKETTRKVLGTAALFIGSFCVMGCVETPGQGTAFGRPLRLGGFDPGCGDVRQRSGIHQGDDEQ